MRSRGRLFASSARLQEAGAWIFLLPAATLLLPFFLLPLAVLLRNSFWIDDPAGFIRPGFTMDNYVLIFTDSYYFEVFLNTLGIAGLVGVICLIVAYPFAFYLIRLSGGSRGFFLWAVYTPLLVSVIVRVFGWTVITADSGLINFLIVGSGLSEEPVRILYEVTGMTIGMVHRYLPLMILPLANSIAKIDPALLRASANLGAGGLRTQIGIVAPLALPGAVTGFQLVFAGALSDYVLPSLMGSTRFRMLAPTIYDEAVTNLAWATTAAMGVTMIAIVAVLLLITNAALRAAAPWARSL